MKLTDLCEEIIWQGKIDGEIYHLVTEGFASKGGLLKSALRKGVAAVKSNPALAGLGAGLAINALNTYQKNKRDTMRLFAKDMREKQQYQKIVNDLMKSGGYKKTKEKHMGGGYMWELKKTR